MSRDSTVVKCQCGIVTRIFTTFTPINSGRRFYKCANPNGYKFAYWKWVDDLLHPRVANLIHNLKKENDNLHRANKILETKMADLEKYLTSEIEQKCERLNEEVVIDNEDVVIDKSKTKLIKYGL
uniref:GRF-type domain-containing protein n=1 Tax=Solanum lycopersicum TaxID=4081 RepID=A0A3Q7H758_SOLLC